MAAAAAVTGTAEAMKKKEDEERKGRGSETGEEDEEIRTWIARAEKACLLITGYLH